MNRAELSAQIDRLTSALRAMRRDMRLCEQIEADMEHIRDQMCIRDSMGTAVFVAVMSAAGGPQGEALLHGLQAAFAGVSMLSALLVILAVVCIGKEESPKNFDCNKEKHHAG